ncbi:MAG: hypothetical protein Q27BB25_07800 [Blastomonas sp. CACIA14H2]|nr:MAG: hypothetical protein Q27BB25_07800 [Blastomonas sp. CACIA14H2]
MGESGTGSTICRPPAEISALPDVNKNPMSAS